MTQQIDSIATVQVKNNGRTSEHSCYEGQEKTKTAEGCEPLLYNDQVRGMVTHTGFTKHATLVET